MIVVPGSINADLVFKVARLPRPGETVLCAGHVVVPGGKGANQAAAAARAGAGVRFVGHVGDDGFGPLLRRRMQEAGVDCEDLAVSTKPTGVAMIGVDAAGENAIIVASGANLDTAAAQVPETMLGPGVTVLCQNEIRPEETFQVLMRAHARGARTVLNMAPAAAVPAEVLRAVDVLVVNEHEAAVVAGVEGVAPEGLAERLAAAHDLSCIVTLGGAGAVAVSGREGWRVPVLPIRPVDTTGAGDTFVGVLTAWLDGGTSLLEALRAASVAAALACEAMGAQTAQPSRAAILDRLPALPPATSL